MGREVDEWQGNGATVKNGSNTLSTSIQITFTRQPGTNPIAGFQCSLDGSEFSSCTSPFVAKNLEAGKQYTFQVMAVPIIVRTAFLYIAIF